MVELAVLSAIIYYGIGSEGERKLGRLHSTKVCGMVQVLTESGGKDSRLSSPGPVSLHLEVPEDASSEMSINAQIDLHNEAMLPDWKTHPLCSGSHHVRSVLGPRMMPH